MTTDSVDILIASYQGEQYIEEQIHSLFQQSHPDLHLIVRDDASNDTTALKIDNLKKKSPFPFTFIQAQDNQGLRQNFSSLLETSQAPYVMFCDQDDWWSPTKVEKTLLVMKKLETTYGKNVPLAVHTDLEVVDKNLNGIHPSFWAYSGLNPHHGHSLNRLLTQNVVTGCTLMINRPLAEIVLPFPEACVMHDWWMSLAASAFGVIEGISEPTMKYRQHDKNDTGAKRYQLLECYKRWSAAESQAKIRVNYQKKFEQAEKFLETYKTRLTQEQQLLIQNFLKLPTASRIDKVCLTYKHRFYKQGLWRNLADMLL